EGCPWRKMNGVGQTVVEGAIGLVMSDPGSAVSQDFFRTLNHLPLLAHTRRMSRNPVDLTSVEDGVDAVEKTITAGVRTVVSGFLVLRGPSIRELPEFDLCAFFAPSHLPGVLLGLAVRKPARVLIAVAHSYDH